MATDAQINANRANAQKSTGPTTPEGKVRAALNALKTGLFAESALIHDEKPEDLAQLTAEWHATHSPVTPEIRSVLGQLIRADWRARRLDKVEQQYWDYVPTKQDTINEEFRLAQAFDHESEKICRLDRLISSNERRYHANLDKLRRLEAELPPPPPEPEPAPAPEPVPPPQPAESPAPEPTIGFVPSHGPIRTFKDEAFYRDYYGLKPNHPLNPYDCPACKVRGRHTWGCGYEPKRKEQYEDDPA